MYIFNNKNSIIKIMIILYLIFINYFIKYFVTFINSPIFKFIITIIIISLSYIDLQLSILIMFSFLLTLHLTNKYWLNKTYNKIWIK